MKKTITKKKLINRVVNITSKNNKTVNTIVQAVFDSISDILVEGNRLEIRNFGVFDLKNRKSRRVGNPNDKNDRVVIPDRIVPVFKPSKLLKQRIKQKPKQND